MANYLDLGSWARRRQFEYFRKYDEPFFSVCANVDVSRMLAVCRAENGPPAFAAYLYTSLLAANEIEPFRYRLRGDRVLVHDVIHAGSAILLDDDTFGFAYFDHQPLFSRFRKSLEAEVSRVRGGDDSFNPRDDKDDLIHCTVLPWVSFTSFSHARNWSTKDSVPKIAFGKFVEANGRWQMPVSVDVHHALMDGLHVGRFYERLQSLMDESETLLLGA